MLTVKKAMNGVTDSLRWWGLSNRQHELYIKCYEHGTVFRIPKYKFSWARRMYKDEIDLMNDIQGLIYAGFIKCVSGHPYSKTAAKYTFSDNWRKMDIKAGVLEEKRPFFLRKIKGKHAK